MYMHMNRHMEKGGCPEQIWFNKHFCAVPILGYKDKRIEIRSKWNLKHLQKFLLKFSLVLRLLSTELCNMVHFLGETFMHSQQDNQLPEGCH